ncbi:hypothetical protein [Rothia terrae]|uniref:Uncharacterized protein n=1 Tax=Rothia terrae TaxID=396015 RepID=A0A7S6WWB4_9MICC|nr:hypothetical protein [Rothia terrae]QOW64718.1 hypothetical protein IDM49_11500 [Rothia terrae]
MVRVRTPRQSVDEFINAAEKPSLEEATSPQTLQEQSEPQGTKERVRARAKSSRKVGAYTIQATKSQKALMDYAAEELDISKAKLLERYFFTTLEEKFGDAVPIHEQ